ncbi:zinc transporter ZIP9-like [Convolutriloba macropyga]|uniref:zinc transporter ZIP9-like n=1 Tax=Convolutriloba macropyga TaxID=536237 RepID=UPI003F51DB52
MQPEMSPNTSSDNQMSFSSFISLIWASIGMFVGCYLAGLIPLTLPLSESKTRSMSVFGSGLLIGTALAVILPEGLNMVQPNMHISAPCLSQPLSGGDLSKQAVQLNHPEDQSVKLSKSEASNVEGGPLFIQKDRIGQSPQDNNRRGPDSARAGGEHKHDTEGSGGGSNGSEIDERDEEMRANRVIGLSLVTGFVFMLFVDHISAGSHSHGPAPHSHSTDSESQHKSEGGNGGNGNSRSRVKLTTTLGLLVHAAADGIAMAAVSASKRSELQVIVFVAIMLHKFPASFGLVSFLLSEKTERQRIRRHLMAFSLAAPVGALVTYLFMAIITTPSVDGGAGGSATIFSNFSGKAMLFSAGTFLYVATIHILPNIQHSSPGGHLSTGHVLLLLVGSFCPTLLNMFHSHDHHSHETHQAQAHIAPHHTHPG